MDESPYRGDVAALEMRITELEEQVSVLETDKACLVRDKRLAEVALKEEVAKKTFLGTVNHLFTDVPFLFTLAVLGLAALIAVPVGVYYVAVLFAGH